MSNKTDIISEAILAKLVPLGALPAELRSQIGTKAKLQEIPTGGHVFQKGDTDNEAVYLVAGEVQFYTGDKVTDTLKADSEAARHPLAPALPRETSAKVGAKTTVLRVNSTLLDTCLIWAQTAEEELEDAEAGTATQWIARISCSGLFARIPAPNVRRIFALMQPVKVKKGDVIIQQGEEGDYYYVIQQGRCVVTRRLPRHDRAVKLAELTVGENFGEEALILDSKRNATITMLTDGVLKRLTKENFVELIKNPVLRSISKDGAMKMDRDGVVWLDVRLSDEYRKTGIKGSLNLPLAVLRREADKLSRNKKYIVYCDTGRRSSAATFLLTERGLDAYHLTGGIMNLSPHGGKPGDLMAKAPSAAMKADLQASQLRVDLARAEQFVSEALHRKADADAAKHATEVQSTHLKGEIGEADKKLLNEIEERLAEKRRRFEAEAERTEETLKEAQRTRLELEAVVQVAEKIASRERTEVEETQAKLGQETENRLREGEIKLEEEYAHISEELEEHQRIREKTEANLLAESGRLETKARAADTGLKEIERQHARALEAKEEVDAGLRAFGETAERKRRELAERENQLRHEAEDRLRNQRKNLEAEFARTLELLEQFRLEQEEAENAKRAAEEKTRRIAAETRAAEERMRREATAKMETERKRLKKEALDISRQLETARKIKEQAESARLIAEEKARKQEDKKTSRRADKKLLAEIKRREEEVTKARLEMETARRAQKSVEVSQHILEETNTGRNRMENTLRRRFMGELDDWKAEEGKLEKIQEKETEKIRARLQRVHERIEADKLADKAATDDMLDEIRSQLGADG